MTDMRARGLALALIFAVLGAGCEPAPGDKSLPDAGSAPSLDGAIDAAKALGLLYGPYDSKLQAARQRSDGNNMLVRALLGQMVQDGGRERYYLATAFVPESPDEPFDCEQCAPTIGLAVFLRTGARWVLESHTPALFEAGMNGQPPSATLVATSPARHDVLFEWSFGNRGVMESFALLAGPAGRQAVALFSLRTASDNGGDCGADTTMEVPCYRYEITLEFRPAPPQAERYEVRARGRGSYLDFADEKKRLHTFDDEATYRFDGAKYVPASLPRQWPLAD